MQSIVMSTSVCVSMCVSVRVSVCPRGYFGSMHARSVPIFVHVAYGHGS